jgi:hypothetical protein
MNAKIIKRLRVDARKETQLAYRHEVYTPRKGLNSNGARSAIKHATPSSGGNIRVVLHFGYESGGD